MSTALARRRMRLALAAPAAWQAAQAGTEELAISQMQVFPVREPVSGRAYAITKIVTREGLTGYGESALPSEAAVKRVGDLIRGRPAHAYERIDHLLEGAGPLRAGVNIALLDILAKHTKVPLFQLLGGPTRNKARVFRPLAGEDDNALERDLENALQEGHKAFGVPAPPVAAINHGMALAQACRRRIERLQARAGEDGDFILLGGGKLSPGDAAMLARECEPLRLMWFDEPCVVGNLAAVAKISEAAVVPVAFGRTLTSGALLQELLRHDAIDLARPPLDQLGVAAIRRMAALAETYYVAVAPGHGGGPVGTAAALHLAASLPHFFIQELPAVSAPADRKMRAAMVSPDVETPRDGYLALPTGPGLGIAVNEQALAAGRGEFA